MANAKLTSAEGIESDKAADYYQHGREEMLAFVPESVGTVLDVGCGEGHFGRSLAGPGREVWGVERNRQHGVLAAQQLDNVVVGDIESVIDDLPYSYFDLVVFNDVLEHLVDPVPVVGRIRSVLKADGVVLSSIPNIRYFPTLSQLVIRGRWEYEDSGVLDRTHLRFFTSSSIVAMYGRAGYDVVRHEGINAMETGSLRRRIANAFLRGPVSDMRYMQFATLARPLPTV